MAKEKDFYFSFYPEAYIMGTMGFTYAQKGKYIDLLCLAFSKGGYLQKKNFKMILNLESEEDIEVFEKFKHDENGYYNSKLLEVILERKRYRESRSKNAKGKKKTTKTEEQIPYKKIIDYFNKERKNSSGKVFKTRYMHTTRDTRAKIKARWNEGFRYNDFLFCIENAWEFRKDDENPLTWFKPGTLFDTKMENRVNGTAYNWTKEKMKNMYSNKPKDIEVDWLDDYIKNME